MAGFGAFSWLASRREVDSLPWPFRKTLEVNEELGARPLQHRAAFPDPRAGSCGTRSCEWRSGLDEAVDVTAWKLRVQGLASEDGPLMLALNAIRRLPRLEMIAEFKCT